MSETKATAKSIARWVWRHFTPSEFRAIQATRGAKGGKVSKGGGRPMGTSRTNWELWEAIQSMKAAGYPHSTIADDLNISASTVSKYAKISK